MGHAKPRRSRGIETLVILLAGTALLIFAFSAPPSNPKHWELVVDKIQQDDLKRQGKPFHDVDLDSVEENRPVWHGGIFWIGTGAIAIGVVRLASSIRAASSGRNQDPP